MFAGRINEKSIDGSKEVTRNINRGSEHTVNLQKPLSKNEKKMEIAFYARYSIDIKLEKLCTVFINPLQDKFLLLKVLE